MDKDEARKILVDGGWTPPRSQKMDISNPGTLPPSQVEIDAKAAYERLNGVPILGKAVQLIYRANQGDQEAFEEMQSLRIAKALQEDDLSEGGYMLDTEYFPEVLRIAETGHLEPLCRRVPMKSKTIDFPDLNSGVSVAWTAEESEITETEPGIGQVGLTAKKLGAYTKISNELIQDSRPDVISFINDLMTEAIGLECDEKILNGTGDPCSGVLTAACGYSVVMTGDSFSNITGTYLSEMISKLKASVLPGCVFVINPEVLHHVRTLTDDNGNYIYSQIGGSPRGGNIWGYPVIQTDAAPRISASSTAFVTFGNFRYFLLGDRLKLSMALDPYSMFITYQSRVRWIRRLAPQIGKATAFCRLLTGS